MATPGDLAWPFFDDGHRALVQELERWAAEALPPLLEGAEHDLDAVYACVRRLVAEWTGIYQYTIDKVIEDMIARSRELKLRLAIPEDQARQAFTVLLTVQVMNYLHSGRHRIAR